MSRVKSLEHLYNEIQILAECDHPNVAKIIEAQFNGVIRNESNNTDSNSLLVQENKDSAD